MDPIGAALFGVTRQAVLRRLFGHADRRFYQRQIIRALQAGSGALQRELEHPAAAGILIRKTFGVAQVLQSGLAALAGKVRLAFLYGSMAAGAGTAGSHMDVMVVGEPVSMDAVVPALGEVFPIGDGNELARLAQLREINGV
jgi:hypothetical protein